MTDNQVQYLFLPYLRRGASGRIAGTKSRRAFINVKIDFDNGKSVTKEALLNAPQDIEGFSDNDAVKAVPTPAPNVNDAEVNNFPFLDFYDEDYPWRYTPEKELENRLRPWLVLVALKPSEIGNFNQTTKRLTISSDAKVEDIFPPTDDLYAWAHIHINDVNDFRYSKGDTSPQYLKDVLKAKPSEKKTILSEFLKAYPDRVVSRIICPRYLEPGINYTCFLLPSYEGGRLKGLGKLEKENRNGQEAIPSFEMNQHSWGGERVFPVYYHWSFTTAAEAKDLEAYFRELTVADQQQVKDIGTLPIHVDLDVWFESLKMKKVIDPKMITFFENNKYGKLINLRGLYFYSGTTSNTVTPSNSQLEDNYKSLIESKFEYDETEQYKDGQYVGDPVVGMPLYAGRFTGNDNPIDDLNSGNKWLTELNLNPEYRIFAGLGANIVRKYQEEYMQEAWEQLEKYNINKINQRVNNAQIAILRNIAIDGRYMQNMLTFKSDKITITNVLRYLLVKAPIFKLPLIKKKMNGADCYCSGFDEIKDKMQVGDAIDFLARTPGSLTKFLRYGGAFGRSYGFGNVNPIVNIASSIEKNLKLTFNGSSVDFLNQFRDKLVKPINIINPFPNQPTPPKPIPIPPLGSWNAHFSKYSDPQFDFSGVAKGQTFQPFSKDLTVFGRGGFDIILLGRGRNINYNEEKNNFNNPIGRNGNVWFDPNSFRVLRGIPSTQTRQTAPQSAKDNYDTSDMSELQKIDAQFQPNSSVRAAFRSENPFGELKPNFDLQATDVSITFPYPMSTILQKEYSEFFCPNIDKLPENSVTILDVNEPLIEAFMVGLNDEMQKEMLWRRFPNKSVGDYFLRFWDMKDNGIKKEGQPIDPNDIDPISSWKLGNKLGESYIEKLKAKYGDPKNNNAFDTTAFAIRSNLFKKYPDVLVYAILVEKGQYEEKDGQVQVKDSFELTKVSDKYLPLFTSLYEPNIKIFHFPLSITSLREGKDDKKYFFVIEERGGKLNFGMDETKPKDGIKSWDDINYETLNIQPSSIVTLNNPIANRLSPLPLTRDASDKDQVNWKEDSAAIAAITFQAPIRAIVPARNMLISQ